MTAYDAQRERRRRPPSTLKRPTPGICHVVHRLLLLAELSSALLLGTLLLPLPRGLGLRTLGVHVLLDSPLASLLGLGLVDLQ
jgi:hypothetical protein